MNLNFELLIASRYLYTKKKENFINFVSLFSLLGIAIGVAALIVVMAVMNGFRAELTSKIIGFNGDLSIQGYGDIEHYEQVRNKLISLKEVELAIPVIDRQVLLQTENLGASGGQIRGIKKEDLQAKKIIEIISGNIEDFNDYSIIIGQNLAFNLALNVGDFLKVVSLNTNSTFLGKIPRFKNFKIIGIFRSGMSEYDSLISFIPLDAAQTFFRLANRVSSLEIDTVDPFIAQNTKFKIMNDLGNNYRIIDWQTRNASFFNALKTERVAMFTILSLIIIVAAFNIISSLIMLVKDKTKDIAILRTIGATRVSIIKIFMIVGSSIGIIGTLIGLVIGISFAKNINSIKIFLEKLTGTKLFDPLIYFLTNLPSKILISDIITIVSLSISIAILATIYPAWRAATLDPVRALRYE